MVLIYDVKKLFCRSVFISPTKSQESDSQENIWGLIYSRIKEMKRISEKQLIKANYNIEGGSPKVLRQPWQKEIIDPREKNAFWVSTHTEASSKSEGRFKARIEGDVYRNAVRPQSAEPYMLCRKEPFRCLWDVIRTKNSLQVECRTRISQRV